MLGGKAANRLPCICTWLSIGDSMLFFIAAFLSCTDPGAPEQSLAQDTSSAPERVAVPLA